MHTRHHAVNAFATLQHHSVKQFTSLHTSQAPQCRVSVASVAGPLNLSNVGSNYQQYTSSVSVWDAGCLAGMSLLTTTSAAACP
jgi:hypothetical protein